MHDVLRQITGTLLVTGGMGFIGSNFVRHILREHPTARVVNLDKVTYAGNPRNLADIAGDARYTFVQADICDAEAVAGALATHRPDQIVHCAAETHVDRSILGGGRLRPDQRGRHPSAPGCRPSGRRAAVSARVHRRGLRVAGIHRARSPRRRRSSRTARTPPARPGRTSWPGPIS